MRTWTTLLGVLTVAGAAVAVDRGYIKSDTAALLVPLGVYMVTKRRTDAAKLDILAGIHSRLITGVPVEVEAVRLAPPTQPAVRERGE